MLLALALAVVPALAAEVLVPPAPTPVPDGVFPASGTVLPANGRLLIADSDRVLITHDDGRVEDLAVGERSVAFGYGDFGIVAPTLAEGETIELERVCSGCGTSEPLSWVVGPVDETAPAFDGGRSTLDASSYGSSWALTLNLSLRSEDEAYLNIAGVAEDVGVEVNVWQVEPGVWSSFSVRGVEHEACFDVVAIDAAGNESEAQRACVDLVDPTNPLHLFGCASTGSANTAVFAVTALLLRRRRR